MTWIAYRVYAVCALVCADSPKPTEDIHTLLYGSFSYSLETTLGGSLEPTESQ